MVPALIATSLAEILGGALGFQILFHIPLVDRRAAHAGARRAGHHRPALRPARAPDHRLSGLHRRRLHRRDLHREARHGGGGPRLDHPDLPGRQHRGRHGHARRDRHAPQHLPALQHHPVAGVGLWRRRPDQAHALRADRHVAVDGHGLARELGDDPRGRGGVLLARHHRQQHPAGVGHPAAAGRAPPRSCSSASPCWSPACRRRSPRRWPRPTSSPATWAGPRTPTAACTASAWWSWRPRPCCSS